MIAFPAPYSPARPQTLILYLCPTVDALFSAAINVPLGWGYPALLWGELTLWQQMA